MTEPKTGETEIVITEYLFAFEDDPIEREQGKLTLQSHVRKAREPVGESSQSATRFVRIRHAPDDRAPYQIQIGTPAGRSLTAWFYSGQRYALLRENLSFGTGVFRPEKQAAR